MSQEHDGVETGAPADEGVVALDGQVEQAAAEVEGEADQDEPEDDEDEPARPGEFVPTDPTMLLGDARDHVLGAIRRSPAWAKLGEKDQRYLANEVEQAQRQVIRGVVRLTASMELDAVEVAVSKPTLTDKDQIEAKITCPFDPDTWAAMPTHSKRMLVFASAEGLMGARAAAVQKDQPGLFDMAETPAQKAEREAIDAEAAEHEAKEREAAEQARLLGQFKPTDDEAPGQGEAAPAAAPAPGPGMSAAERAAYDRGVARRAHGGVRTLPEDLLDKDMVGDSAEPRAFHAGYDAPLPEPEPAPAKAPRGHRGRRTSTEERTSKRLASAEA